MGLKHLSLSAVIALLGVIPVLHAETGEQADTSPPEEEVSQPASDPALDASPIADSEPAETPTADSETVVHPADVVEPAAEEKKGDTLSLPKAPPSPPKKAAKSMPIKVDVDGMPGRGASMDQVEKRFGPPREKLPPVGDPPITRWNYGDYTVYFEYQYVIHSVGKEAAGAQASPAPGSEMPATSEPATATSPQE